MIAKGRFVFLCAVFIVGVTGALTFGQAAIPLEQAVKDGKVEVKITGTGASTGDAILITARRKLPEVVRLTLTPGTVFKSVSGTVQNMFGASIKGERVGEKSYRPTTEIVLRDNDTHTYVIEAYCLDFHKGNPGRSDSFSIASRDERALTILRAGKTKRASIQAVQAAVWMDRDGATVRQLQQRFPASDADIQVAKALLDELKHLGAGTPTTSAGTITPPVMHKRSKTTLETQPKATAVGQRRPAEEWKTYKLAPKATKIIADGWVFSPKAIDFVREVARKNNVLASAPYKSGLDFAKIVAEYGKPDEVTESSIVVGSSLPVQTETVNVNWYGPLGIGVSKDKNQVVALFPRDEPKGFWKTLDPDDLRSSSAARDDWRKILLDGKVFSKEHLDRFRKGLLMLTLAFSPKGQALELLAEGGKTVGWQAQRLESVYGAPSAKAKSNDGEYTTWFYGEVGVLVNSQTQDVVGVHVPVDTAGENFRKALELGLARNDAKQSGPTTNVPQQAAKPIEPELRGWSDATGKFRTEAVFLGLEDGKVRLKKKDGKVVIVPLDKLSKEDQQWVKQGELARNKAPSATHDPQQRYRRSGVPNQTRNITVKSIGGGRQEIKGGPVSVVDGKDIFEGPGTRDVHIEIDRAVGKTTYCGLTFTTPCVLDIRSDGTLLVDKEGIHALDEKQNTWESQKTTIDGKPAIAFFPSVEANVPTKPQPSGKPETKPSSEEHPEGDADEKTRNSVEAGPWRLQVMSFTTQPTYDIDGGHSGTRKLEHRITATPGDVLALIKIRCQQLRAYTEAEEEEISDSGELKKYLPAWERLFDKSAFLGSPSFVLCYIGEVTLEKKFIVSLCQWLNTNKNLLSFAVWATKEVYAHARKSETDVEATLVFLYNANDKHPILLFSPVPGGSKTVAVRISVQDGAKARFEYGTAKEMRKYIPEDFRGRVAPGGPDDFPE